MIKKGRSLQPKHLLQGFRKTISTCQLMDLPLHDSKFTWERGRGTDIWVRERLDRAFTMQSWLVYVSSVQVVKFLGF